MFAPFTPKLFYCHFNNLAAAYKIIPLASVFCYTFGGICKSLSMKIFWIRCPARRYFELKFSRYCIVRKIPQLRFEKNQVIDSTPYMQAPFNKIQKALLHHI